MSENLSQTAKQNSQLVEYEQPRRYTIKDIDLIKNQILNYGNDLLFPFFIIDLGLSKESERRLEK